MWVGTDNRRCEGRSGQRSISWHRRIRYCVFCVYCLALERLNMTPKSALLIFIAAVLTILLFGFCPAIIRSLRSRAWPHAIGHITEISIYHDPPVRRVYIWRVRMRYIFNINGKKFYGTRYTSTGEFYSGRKDYCGNFLNNHPVGSVVTVYYNPQNP